MAEWGKIGSRGNVEDRRGFGSVAGGISLTGVVVLLLFNILTGGTPEDVLTQLNEIPVERQLGVSKEAFEGEDSYEVFASTVLGSNNEMWSRVFEKDGQTYTPPKLVLFRSATESGCGLSTSQVGPHYCPLDETIYLDETFFDELRNRFGAEGGDVAEAYVISHEVAHHAQNKLGIMSEASSLQEDDPNIANDISIKLELQADCFAGLWSNSIKELEVLNPGEIREAMDAAAAVGDDRVQERVTGQVNPENWTHGSSDQRVDWFNRGYESGVLSSCDTFK